MSEDTVSMHSFDSGGQLAVTRHAMVTNSKLIYIWLWWPKYYFCLAKAYNLLLFFPGNCNSSWAIHVWMHSQRQNSNHSCTKLPALLSSQRLWQNILHFDPKTIHLKYTLNGIHFLNRKLKLQLMLRSSSSWQDHDDLYVRIANNAAWCTSVQPNWAKAQTDLLWSSHPQFCVSEMQHAV